LRRNRPTKTIQCSSRNNFRVLAKQGRDKVTLSPGISDLGAWLEQLLAESTGKDGLGLIPIDREPLVDQRFMAAIAYSSILNWTSDPCQDAAVDALQKSRTQRYAFNYRLPTRSGVFPLEIATAVAGSIIGINALTSQMWKRAKCNAAVDV